MKQVTLNIPDKEYSFVLQLLKKLGSITITEKDLAIPEEHKNLIRQRRNSAKETDLVKWKDARKSLGLRKNGL